MKASDRSMTRLIVMIVGLALGVRLAMVGLSPLPLNDGRLFFSFIADLVAGGLRLPTYSSYNAASIPLAYPPLGFYLIATLNLLLRIPVLQLLRILPVLLSVASIPAFFLFAAELLRSRNQAALATLVFALLPRTSDWLIMGGGITRSLGLLFALLLMRQAFLLFDRRQTSAIPLAILFGTLLVCSHPEAATHTALTATLLYAWRDRSRIGLRYAAVVAGGIIAASAPWWVVIVTRHGLVPFSAAAAAAREDSYNVLAGLLILFRLDFTDEPVLRIFAALGLLGMLIKVSRREYFLGTWFLLLHTVEPRGGTLFMMIPLALGAGFCLETFMLPPLRHTRRSPEATTGRSGASDSAHSNEMLPAKGARLVLALLALYGCVSSYAVGLRIQREFTLTWRELQAFEWVREHTSHGSRFALVTGALPLRDASSEWFPALTNRRSLATVFGMEWVRGVDFADQTERYRSLQACAREDATCLEAWAREQAQVFDYVYVRGGEAAESMALRESLARSPEYALVYAHEGIAIFKRE